MTTIQTKPLTPHFGVEVSGMALSDVSAGQNFAELRALFEEHSALLFRAQDISNAEHMALAQLFGPIEDRKADERKPARNSRCPRCPTCRKTAPRRARWICTR